MLGLYEKQSDPGWWVLNCLMNFGLVWDVKLPQDMEYRPELEQLTRRSISENESVYQRNAH